MVQQISRTNSSCITETFPGGGHGNPFQYSCLGNPMDRGAWCATVQGVAKSQTRLSDSTTETLYSLNSSSPLPPPPSPVTTVLLSASVTIWDFSYKGALCSISPVLSDYGLPRQLNVRNLPAKQETRVQSLGWKNPPGVGQGSSPVFLPGKFHGQRSLVDYSPQGWKEVDSTERLNNSSSSSLAHFIVL